MTGVIIAILAAWWHNTNGTIFNPSRNYLITLYEHLITKILAFYSGFWYRSTKRPSLKLSVGKMLMFPDHRNHISLKIFPQINSAEIRSWIISTSIALVVTSTFEKFTYEIFFWNRLHLFEYYESKGILNISKKIHLPQKCISFWRCKVRLFCTAVDKAKLTNTKEGDLNTAIKERNQAMDQLRTMESAFSDLYGRYEKAKSALETMNNVGQFWIIFDIARSKLQL